MFRVVSIVLVVGALGLGGLRVMSALGVGSSPVSHGDGTGASPEPVSYQQVSGHAEAHLFYPGSAVVSRFGGAEYRHPLAGNVDPAFAGAILASAAKPEQMYLWYQLWLLKHGWRSVAVPNVTTWLSREGYARGTRELFVVAMDNPRLLGETVGKRLPTGQTIYEISYSISPAHK